MHRYEKFIITLFILCSASYLYSEESAKIERTDTGSEYSTSDELIEWGIYSSIYLGAHYIDKNSPFSDAPLLAGETDKPYKDDTIPAQWLGYWMYCTYGYIALIPNNEGFFNRITYNNIKGLYESVGYSYFATSATKAVFGKKRPSYNNYPEYKKETEGRESFASGHSSTSFALSTYGSLYVIEHSGSNDSVLNFALKTIAVTALNSAASYVSWTRIDDNRHFPVDVIGGAAIGIVSGFAGYMHQNGWFKKLFSAEDISITPCTTKDQAGILFVRSF